MSTMEPSPGFSGDFFPGLNKREIFSLFLILAFAAISFSPILKNSFVDWDDPEYILNNPVIQQMSFNNFKSIFFTFRYANFHPLTTLSNAIEYAWFGPDPWYFHFDNLLLHLLNMVLVYGFARRLTGSAGTAFLVVGFFGIHPLKVESVAWASERKDLLYSFFFLASILLYDRFLETNRDMYKNGSLVIFCASLLSKGQAVTLPLVLLLLDVFRGRSLGKKELAEKKFFFFLAGCLALIIFHGQEKEGAVIHEIPWYSPLFLSSFGIVFYLSKIFFPVHLCHFYPYSNDILQVVSPACIAAPVVLLGLFISLRMLSKEFSFAGFGGWFFLLTLLPVLQIIPYASVFAADRYTYLAILGPALMVAEILKRIHSRLAEKGGMGQGILRLILVGIFLSMAMGTIDRCRVWENTISLWSDMISTYPDHPRGYLNRGMFFLKEGRFDAAEADLGKARELDEKSPGVICGWGTLHLRQGKVREAVLEFERAKRLAPGFLEANFNLGLAFLLMEEPEKAITELSVVLGHRPGNWEALGNRAIAHAKLRHWAEAQEDINAALALFPHNPGLESTRDTIAKARSGNERR